MNRSYLHPAEQLVMIMQRIYDKGMTTTSGGNLSIMDDEGNLWITPGSIDKGTLTPKDICRVLPDGTVEGIHKPSCELPFHQSVYRRRPDLKSVLHAHPCNLVGYSIARVLPDLTLLPTIAQASETIAMADYAVPGSLELGENIAKRFDEGCNTVLLENHGICMGASDIFTAYKKFETIEFAAGLGILANRIGKAHSLSKEALALAASIDPAAMDEFVPCAPSCDECNARREMAKMIARSYRLGLFGATQGVYSVRITKDTFLITPHGADRNNIEPEDLVLVKGGKREAGKIPSLYAKLMGEIYAANPDINSVILAQPKHVMAFAVTDHVFDPRTIPESYIQLQAIERIDGSELYAAPETTARRFGPKVPALLCQNDSIITTGTTMLQAFDRLEVAEATAHSIIAAKDVGPVQYITEKEVTDLKVAFGLPM